MTQAQDNHPTPLMNAPENEFDDEINLLDLLQVILKRKKIIAQIVGGAIVLSVIASLLLPKMYTATARVLPPSESGSSISSLLSQAGGAFAGLAGGLISGKTTAELYRGILESRTVADALVERFNLKERYDKKYLADVYKELAKRADISVSRKDEIISVSIEDRDPQLAADMANFYVEMLDKMNRTVNINEGQRKRIFLEDRLKKVQEDLEKAETALKEFQETYKVVAIEEQAKVAIEGAARIKGEIIMSQTELEVLKQFGTERQNEAIMLKSRIDELQNQLERIEKGTRRKESSDPPQISGADTDFYIPFDELPALGMQLLRLMREAKIQEKVFELMTTQYELAKIEEAKDVNTIQVLDRAVAPDKKSSPKRSLIVVLSTFMAFFAAIFMAFIMEYIDRLKTEDPERYQQIKEGLRVRK